MEYISDKVSMFVGEASSRVNDSRRKWQEQRELKRRQSAEAEQSDAQQASAIDRGAKSAIGSSSNKSHQLYGQASAASPLARGFPFGGDSFAHDAGRRAAPPPPIGFRVGLAEERPTTEQPGAQETPPAPQAGALDESNESLYKGDAWARLWFQRVLILSLLRLLLFVRKVYEDFQATKRYNLTGATGHFLLALATLFLPTAVFTLYRVSRYLQLALPPLRQPPYPSKPASHAAAGAAEESEGARLRRDEASKRHKGAARDDDEGQLTRALMSSPVHSTTESIRPQSRVDTEATSLAAGRSLPAASDENEGLVTARQTPTNLGSDEFHDSKSQQDSAVASDLQAPRAPSRASRALKGGGGGGGGDQAQPLESVKIDKLLPEAHEQRETTRVVTGAGEQLLHGVLFIFWQLKRQVDVLGYLVERACLWRKPAEHEKEELGRLRTGSDGLEWFQDFYAAFLAILAQVYTLGLYWTGDERWEALAKQMSADQAHAATGGLASSGAPDSTGPGGEMTRSEAARIIGNLLSSQAAAGNTLGIKDVLIMSELVVSTAVVLSLLIAVRRRDDGPLTLGLSMLGWGSLFSARIIVIALSFVHLGWRPMLPLVGLHVLFITLWIYSIALASHNDAPDERLDEARWDEATAIELGQVEGDGEQDAADQAENPEQQQQQQQQQPKREPSAGAQTSQWSVAEHLVLLTQILALFAIPSLFYWPIMFNLKLHFRPFKYLVLILLENFLLITAIWFNLAQRAPTAGQLYLLGFVGGASIIGFLFIALYVMCKPSLTEYFARADEMFNAAEKAGIYYEFCSRVFKMPDLGKQTFRRLMDQAEVVEELIVEGGEDAAGERAES